MQQMGIYQSPSSQLNTTPISHQQTTHPFISQEYLEMGDDGKSSDNSDTDSMSPLQSSFSAPPIRTAVLKKMFPDQKSHPSVSSSGGSTAGTSGVVTKTMFTGTVGSTRKCVECDAINSKMAKKCQQCKAPLQVIQIVMVNVCT